MGSKYGNIVNDPYAAEIVFGSGANIFVAGLDVSLKTLTSAEAFLSSGHTGLMKILIYTMIL